MRFTSTTKSDAVYCSDHCNIFWKYAIRLNLHSAQLASLHVCHCVPFSAGMGVKGLQGFLDRCCPQACVPVDLKEMAGRHVSQRTAESHKKTKQWQKIFKRLSEWFWFKSDT